MRYTKQQLQSMSDFEINKALCIKLGYDVTGVTEQINYMTNAVADFCHQWHLIMNLATMYTIALEPVDSVNNLTWVAGANTYFGFTDKSPQRAIACCLLLMEELK